jgi:SAM-dependent methyltransferase
MEFDELKQAWETLGRTDPLWAILTDPGRRGGRWDPAEFFETGRRTVGKVMRAIDQRGSLPRRERALDFGCGVGRLTQALCDHFDLVDGVDVAASMIERARGYNRFGDRCRYTINDRPDLSLYADGSFDLVSSSLVLQHMRPEYAARYVAEFARVVRIGGIIWFQLPSHVRPVAVVPPLAEEGFRAVLSSDRADVSARTTDELTVLVRVLNASEHPWPSVMETRGVRDVSLGSRWREPAGDWLREGERRARLTKRLASGSSSDLVLVLRAPAHPGRYELVVDMVEEGVAWFAARGSEPLVIPATIEAPADPVEAARPGPAQRLDEARMEMHGARPDVVLSWLGTGVDILEISQDQAAGARWVSYRYLGQRIA